MRGLITALRREPMSGTYDRARRYSDRANECLEIIASSQTPGTGTIHLLIAEHYLRLAASEKKRIESVQQSSTDRTAGNFSIWRLGRIQSFVSPTLSYPLSTRSEYSETCIERF